MLDNYRVTIGNFFNKSSIDFLIESGFIEFINKERGYFLDNLSLTKNYSKTFEEKVTPNLNTWFEEWFELWPKGVKTGGYLVRSDKKGCLNKLKKFNKEYPEYFDKDLIMKATSEYIEECRMRNFDKMQLAHYFIFKDGISNLAAFCENAINTPDKPTGSFSKSLN